MKPVGTLTWLSDGVTQDAYEELNLLAHAAMFERTLRQACGGQAECGTCRVRVVGEVTGMTIDEREFRTAHPRVLADGERLACQCRPIGDVGVFVRKRGYKDLRFALPQDAVFGYSGARDEARNDPPRKAR